MGVEISTTAVDREKKMMEAGGLVAQTTPFLTTGGATTLTSGKLYGVGVWLPAGLTITNMHIWVEMVAATVTLTRVGVYDSAFALVASTDNDATLQTSSAFRSKALSSPYKTPTDGVYYFAYLNVASTPGALFRSGGIPASGVPRIGSNAYFYWAQSGRTDLPATATPGSGNGPTAYWIGAS